MKKELYLYQPFSSEPDKTSLDDDDMALNLVDIFDMTANRLMATKDTWHRERLLSQKIHLYEEAKGYHFSVLLHKKKISKDTKLSDLLYEIRTIEDEFVGVCQLELIV